MQSQPKPTESALHEPLSEDLRHLAQTCANARRNATIGNRWRKGTVATGDKRQLDAVFDIRATQPELG